MNGIFVEMLKNGGLSITDRLLKIFNRFRETGVVPEDWKVECITPIYKGKCDKKEYTNYKGITILNI